MRRAAFGSAACALLLCGCVALGWKFGPGFSARDTRLFAKPPVVVHRAGEYFLSWTQGSSPFYFFPASEVREGRLVFALVATSSTGRLEGRHREEKIEGADELAALRRGGAFWWEPEPAPDGTLVRLEVVEAPARE